MKGAGLQDKAKRPASALMLTDESLCSSLEVPALKVSPSDILGGKNTVASSWQIVLFVLLT